MGGQDKGVGVQKLLEHAVLPDGAEQAHPLTEPQLRNPPLELGPEAPRALLARDAQRGGDATVEEPAEGEEEVAQAPRGLAPCRPAIGPAEAQPAPSQPTSGARAPPPRARRPGFAHPGPLPDPPVCFNAGTRERRWSEL